MGGVTSCGRAGPEYRHVMATPLRLLDRPAARASALLALLLLAPAAARAAAVDEELRWIAPADPGVAGFVVYLGATAGNYTESFDVGWIEPDDQDVARMAFASLPSELTSDDVYVAMTSYYSDTEGGIALESPHSNELYYPVGIVTTSDPPSDGTDPGSDPTDPGPQDPPTEDPPSEPVDPPPADPAGDDPEAPPPPLPRDFDWAEAFDGYADGSDPDGWVDGVGQSSLHDDPTRFAVATVDDDPALDAAASNELIHSHYAVAGSEWWNAYQLSGRLATSDAAGRVGVTLLSALPDLADALALEHVPGAGFRIGRLGGAAPACLGRLPAAAGGAWHRFKVESHAQGDALRLRAKVWRDGASEPRAWMLDCRTDAAAAPQRGRVGVLAAGPGRKHWDDLRAIPVDARGRPLPQCAEAADCGAGATCSADLVCSVEAKAPADALYHDDFESAEYGALPAAWSATEARHSLARADESLVRVFQEPGHWNRVLGSHDAGAGVHAHLRVPEGEGWRDVEWSGRMLQSHPDGGIGVTIHSAYPERDAYYALRSQTGGPFHLASRRGAVSAPETCRGRLVSPVAAEPGTWVRFRIRTRSGADGVRVRARVWPEDGSEPSDWPIDCVDPAAGAFEAGTVGVLADGTGRQYWDDLTLRPTP